MRTLLPLLILTMSIPSSEATSFGKTNTRGKSVCSISAKFIQAKQVGKKVVWVFSPLGPIDRTHCASITDSIQVRIPSGSYSTLSHSFVYPISITEPPTGAEVHLRLEKVTFRTGEVAWLLGEGDKALQVRN